MLWIEKMKIICASLALSIATASTEIENWQVSPFSFPPAMTVGKRATALCATNTGKGLNFHWLKNGKRLDQSPHIQIRSYTDSSMILIEPLSIEDSGNYTCVVKSDHITDSYTTALDVLISPSWIQRPSDKDVLAGNSVTLSCYGTGKPEPTVHWYHSRIGESSFSPVISGVEKKLEANGSLYWSSVQKSDEGLFKCNLSNGVGAALEATFSLKVIVPARFEEKFVMQTVRRGETATLRCDALGDKPLSVTWTKDKAEIDFRLHTRLEKFDRETSGGVSSELLVRGADRKDGALYGCLAANEHGKDDRNLKLLVVEVPAPPLDVKAKESWARTASVHWSAPYSGNSPLTKYTVQYWRDRGGPHRLLEEGVSAAHTSLLLKKLQPGTPYAVAVLAENEIGQGQPSDLLHFRTGDEEPSGPPTDVWIEARSSSSILVTWKPPPRELWNGELRGYFVGYRAEGSSQPYSFKSVDGGGNATRQQYALAGLAKSTRYSVVVKAYNGAGTGPPSQDLVAKTLDGDVPDAPAFTVVAASESKISVRWGDPPSRNIPVTGYTLHYRKAEGGEEWLRVPLIASSSRSRFTLTGLESGRAYALYLTASNQHGSGPPGDTATLTTSSAGFVVGGSSASVDLSVAVPVAACVLAFLVVALVLLVYYRKSKARTHLAAGKGLGGGGGGGGKAFPYQGSSTQRYIDIDKTRGGVAAEPGALGSSYATIPAHEEDGLPHEMKAFMHGNMKDRPLPSKPSSLKKKKQNKGHVYDTAQ